MWLVPAFHQGPRPLLADFHARAPSSPRACSRLLRVAGRFHCRQSRQRIIEKDILALAEFLVDVDAFLAQGVNKHFRQGFAQQVQILPLGMIGRRRRISTKRICVSYWR